MQSRRNDIHPLESPLGVGQGKPAPDFCKRGAL